MKYYIDDPIEVWDARAVDRGRLGGEAMSTTKERPIPFSGPMVRAILDRRKTQTRRVVKNPENYGCPTGDCPHGTQRECRQSMNESDVLADGPFGKPGDRLWVRESWYYDIPPHKLPSKRPADFEPDHLYFRADGECCQQIPECQCAEVGKPRWRSSFFLPRWASRITLEVTGVRAERLQDITEEDAIAEGFASVAEFMAYWDTLNAKRSPWSANQWVWVVDFKRVEGKP
jgi:hypothetical protein